MNNSTKNILIVGVGGQGVILASNALSEVAMMCGYDVKKNESHGQSQRGGTVPSHVRYGKKVYSPLISCGEADVVLSFEELEGLRFAHFLKADGNMILNRQRIYPPRVTSGLDQYPENVGSLLKQNEIKTLEIDGLSIATKLGNPMVVSTVLLGALSKHLEFSEKNWIEVIKRLVPPKYQKDNLNAFEEGRKFEYDSKS